LVISARRAIFRAIRPAPCRSGRRPSTARNPGRPCVHRRPNRSLGSARRQRDGHYLGSLRVVLRARRPRPRPRCSISAAVASEPAALQRPQRNQRVLSPRTEPGGN
jgi:hypothetical protein